MSEEAIARFLDGKRRYYEEYFRTYGRHPNKGRHPPTEFKKGNRLWVGRHHSDATKAKLSLAFKGQKLSGDIRKRISEGHMGLVPWNKGLTKEKSPSVAMIGVKGRARWTPERRRASGERGRRYWSAWWKAHPEAKETITQINRPTKIEMMARDSLSKRGVSFEVAKRVENLCYPDYFYPNRRLRFFATGAFGTPVPNTIQQSLIGYGARLRMTSSRASSPREVGEFW
jgi:hypothetical protein